MNKETDVHHRRARSLGGTNEKRNTVTVRRTKHEAFHKLFGAGDPLEVAKILNETWLDPDYVMIPVHKADIARLLAHFDYKKYKKLLAK